MILTSQRRLHPTTNLRNTTAVFPQLPQVEHKAPDSAAVPLAASAAPAEPDVALPPPPKPKAKPAPPSARPENDSFRVSELRGQLRLLRGTGMDHERRVLAQRITLERYPLTTREHARVSEERDEQFRRQYAADGSAPIAAAHAKYDAERVPSFRKAASNNGSPPPQVSPSATTATGVTAPATATAAPMLVNATKRGEDMTDAEALEARDKLVAEFRQLLEEINSMKEKQDSWKETLHNMFRQEAEEDDRARKLFTEVMTSEAFFLGDRHFREWMANREGAKVGVGAEGLSRWFDNDALLQATPFAAVMPYPRQLSDEGRREVAATVDELLAEDPTHAGFIIDCHTAHPHHSAASPKGNEAALEGPNTPATEDRLCRTGAEVLAAVDRSEALRSYLDHNPVLFFSSASTYSQAMPTSSLVKLFVAGGQPLALECHDRDKGNAVKVYSMDATDRDVLRQVSRSALCLFASIKPHLAKRTYIALLRVTNTGDALRGDNFDVRLLNIAPLEPRDYAYFEWPDIVGLIAMALNNVRRMETRAEATQREAFDVDAAAASMQVRGAIQVLEESSVPLVEVVQSPTSAMTGRATTDAAGRVMKDFLNATAQETQPASPATFVNSAVADNLGVDHSTGASPVVEAPSADRGPRNGTAKDQQGGAVPAWLFVAGAAAAVAAALLLRRQPM
jgi:hypothetical protein